MEASSEHQEFSIAYLQTCNLSILLADDNRVNQFLGKRILQNIGITQIDLASDGSEALELAGKKKYDLILTDVEMPGMSGYELARALHASLKPECMPLIIALTANASDEDREEARLSGIADYLTKPYSPQDLMEMIMRHFSKSDNTKPADVSIQAAPASNPSLNKVYELFNSNQEDIQHFLLMLSTQIPALIQDIKNGIFKDEWEQSFQAAHKLKSPVTLLGNIELANALGLFTEELRHRNDLAAIPSALENLLPPLESLLVLINTELEKIK